MGTKSREVIWGSAIMGAKMSAKAAREDAQKAARRGGSSRDPGRRIYPSKCIKCDGSGHMKEAAN
jgi:hypothetical protein